MLLDMLALHNDLVEVQSFIGETRHLTSTHGAAAEKTCGADVINTGQSAGTILTGCNYPTLPKIFLFTLSVK